MTVQSEGAPESESFVDRMGIAPAAIVVLCSGIAWCGGGGGSSTSTGAQNNLIHSNPANGKTTITVGSKNFTEEFVLGEIYAQALRAAGYKVKTGSTWVRRRWR